MFASEKFYKMLARETLEKYFSGVEKQSRIKKSLERCGSG
jgi:hypothetical protein